MEQQAAYQQHPQAGTFYDQSTPPEKEQIYANQQAGYGGYQQHQQVPQQQYAGYEHHNGYQQQPQQSNSGYAAPTSDYSTAHGAPGPAQIYDGGKNSGMKKGLLLGLIAAIVVLALLVIGLGAGLGVTKANLNKAQSDLANALSSVSASQATATATPTTTSTPQTSISASPSASATAAVKCPVTNGTLYTSSKGADKRFRQSCGIDYSGQGNAIDVGNVKVATFHDCLDACSAQANCTAAGWGVMQGDANNQHTCWMKANVTNSHTATPDWAFGVALSNAGGNSTSKRDAALGKRMLSWF